GTGPPPAAGARAGRRAAADPAHRFASRGRHAGLPPHASSQQREAGLVTKAWARTPATDGSGPRGYFVNTWRLPMKCASGTTLIPRDAGLTQMSEATAPSPLPAVGHERGHAPPQPGRGPGRRQERPWVPLTTRWLCLLIGLADVVSAVIPRLQLVHRLHRITPFVPGVLTNVTFTADVIIGLLLLMLSHGLRRRKRRAWQAVTLLLAFSVVIHVVH